MSTPEASLQPDSWSKAKAKDMPVGRLIGFETKEAADGRAVVTLASGPQHANPMGTLHGGILCDIADAAMGIAFASTLAPDEFPPPGMGGCLKGRGQSGATRRHCRLCRVRNHRRK
jgi:acyl-coenzyme A thioesterase PaaI-like protein